MNGTVLLDTNGLIRLFKGTSREISRALMGSSRLVIPLAVAAEFLSGLEAQGVATKKEGELYRELLATPNTEVHRPTEVTARFYAKIYNELRRRGTPIPTNDIWIAAETMEVGGTLYSCDRHFESVPLLNWVYCE